MYEQDFSLSDYNAVIKRELDLEALHELPFSTWVIVRFNSYSHGRNKSNKALKEQREYSLRNPGKKPPIKRYKKKYSNEVLLVGFKTNGRYKFFDISPDSKRKDRLRRGLDIYIKQELRDRNVDLDLLGKNEIDYFLECVEKILKIKRNLGL